MKTITHMKGQVERYQKTLLWGVVGIILASCLFYIYCINMTVLHVVSREKAEKHIAELTTHVGDLEFKNISLKNSLTLDVAEREGFVESSHTIFLSRGDTKLSYNTR